jgi:uncharacterized caspase-like protein
LVSKTCIGGFAAALLLAAVPCSAQSSRKMEFLLGSLGNQVSVKVEYPDPYTVDPLLTDSLVLPVNIEVRNVSGGPVRFNYEELHLNLGENVSLPAVAPDAVSREIVRQRRVPSLLRFLGDNASTFQPKLLETVLKKRQLKDGDIPPNRSKEGLVFFIRPAGTNAASTGVMWLETTGRSPQMLETKDIAVTTRRQQTASFTDKLKQALTKIFGAPPAFDKSYALLVGVGNYRYLPPLSGPPSDVKKMKEYLEAQGFDEVVAPTEDSVTIDKLKNPQQYFASKLGPKDRFLFYYSGHGTEESVGNKIRGYLPLKDEVPSGHDRSIPMDSLVGWMKGLKVEHLLVILDACFSGLATNGAVLEKYAIGTADPKLDQEALNRLSRGSARYLLTAGNKGQESFGGPTWNGSLFTDTLIKGLKKDVDPYHNKIVTTRALYVWLLDAVFKEARKVNRELTPLFVDLNPTGSDGDFIFVQ